MSQLLQNLIDGVGRGSLYSLLALGVAVIFGVMHLLNFAHGELITVSGYSASFLFASGLSWWTISPIIVVVCVVAALVVERLAFRPVRGSSDFTMLLTSFGIHFLVAAAFLMYVGATVKTFPTPGWVNDTVTPGPLSLEIFDLVVIGTTAVVLAATVLILQRTRFGLALRAAAADFDAARLMGVNSDRVIQGAFVMSGALAGVASIFWLMRAGNATPTAGIDPMLSGVLAALIGGLGSLRGAVLGGLALGIAEVMLRSRLPEGMAALTDAILFGLIALLFIFRPQGLIAVARAERV